MAAWQTFNDHLNRSVSFKYPPRRIVSLCPSITETLYALGLANEVVGRTRFCIHPRDQVGRSVMVGGTKQIKEEAILDLNPDLIIAEKEENPKEMVESLEKHYPVYVTDVESVQDAIQMILDLGLVTGTDDQAKSMVLQIQEEFGKYPLPKKVYRVAYLIWKKPYMAAGNHTYIHSMLQTCGFVNVFKESSDRYPMVNEEDLKKASPDFIFLSSEPYPFKPVHQQELQQIIPEAKTLLVDGEIFSWYGSRMVKAPKYFYELRQKMDRLLG